MALPPFNEGRAPRTARLGAFFGGGLAALAVSVAALKPSPLDAPALVVGAYLGLGIAEAVWRHPNRSDDRDRRS